MENVPTVNITDEGTTVPDVNLALGLTIELAILLILLENLLILLTTRLYKKLKIVDMLILSLAGSDFVNALLPLQILNVKANFIITSWPPLLCGTFVWTTYTLRIASVSTVSLMSIEKAMLLINPLKYYTQLTLCLARKLILGAWVLSAIIATLAATLKNYQTDNKDVHCRYQPHEFGLGFGVFVEAIAVFHFVIVLGSYVAMVVSSKGFRRRQKSMLSSQRKKEMNGKQGCEETQGMLQARQLCRVMGYVVTLYYVTWLPFVVRLISVQLIYLKSLHLYYIFRFSVQNNIGTMYTVNIFRNIYFYVFDERSYH
jgi:5-hydroxytryptamine receptor 7